MLSITEVADQRTLEQDRKPDPFTWAALGLVVILGLGVYLMYAEPYANSIAMKIVGGVAGAGMLMLARASWVAVGFNVTLRMWLSVALIIIAAGTASVAFIAT